MLESLRFPPYRLGSLLPLAPPVVGRPSFSEDGQTSLDDSAPVESREPQDRLSQPSGKDNPSTQPSHLKTRPAKPLWNPALDLSTTAHNSPKKGDTAESLPVVTSNLDPETAMTLNSAKASSPGEDASTVKDTGKREGREGNSPYGNRQLQTETFQKEPIAFTTKRNDAAETPLPPAMTQNNLTAGKETKGEYLGRRSIPSETFNRKRKEPGSARCPSPTQAKSLSQVPENLTCNKRDRVEASQDSVEKGSLPAQPQENPLSFTGEMRCVGGITTDSHAYQHFHHQRRLALLASNLLQMGSQGHPNLLGHHPHMHLIPPQLPHHHHHHHQQHHNIRQKQPPPCTPAVLPHHPGLSIHSALALAQSREVLERLSASTAFPNTSSACDHLHRHHGNHSCKQLHSTQQQQRQIPNNLHESKQPQKDNHQTPSHSTNSTALSSSPFITNHHKPDKLHPPHPLTLQNALVLAQSRALMERVNAGPILPHGLKNDPFLSNPHHPHHPHSQPHPQPGMISPHAGNATAGTVAGLGMGVTINPASGAVSAGGASYGRKLFPCPQCRYTTDRRNNLKRHMLTMHQTSSKMLECCGILFSTKASLREHAMIFHYHGYTCYFCGRRFCRKALLKRHLSVHNGQKDFVCTICDYATSHKSNLERHRKVHTRQEGDEDNHGEAGEQSSSSGDFRPRYHDDMKSNGSEAVSHDDVSDDDLSVGSDYEDDIDVEIDVQSD